MPFKAFETISEVARSGRHLQLIQNGVKSFDLVVAQTRQQIMLSCLHPWHDLGVQSLTRFGWGQYALALIVRIDTAQHVPLLDQRLDCAADLRLVHSPVTHDLGHCAFAAIHGKDQDTPFRLPDVGTQLQYVLGLAVQCSLQPVQPKRHKIAQVLRRIQLCSMFHKRFVR